MGWVEAWRLTEGLLRDPDSHCVAALAGWSYVPGAVTRTVTDVWEQYVNANQARGKVRFRAARPWTVAAPKDRAAVTAEDRRQRAELASRLGMPVS
jgi:hypothetical protein